MHFYFYPYMQCDWKFRFMDQNNMSKHKSEDNVFVSYLICTHSSEIRGLCKMKWPSELLQNLPYFWNTRPTKFYFCFFISYYTLFLTRQKPLASSRNVFFFSFFFFLSFAKFVLFPPFSLVHSVFYLFWTSLKPLADFLWNRKCISWLPIKPEVH